MPTPSTIRLLASTNNARGDLFTRLVKDLFFTLGYDNLRLDVHKSGREIDILGTHRLEPRHMAAECKAHADRIGGDDLNKFFGALSRERDKHRPTPVVGYFVSLSGFRETGKEQEFETSEQKRVILIDGKQIIEELQRSRVLVPHTEAAEKAGRCAEHGALKDGVLDGIELLGHERGYLWAVFYSYGKSRTHFTLIHADGTPLTESVALDVIDADRHCGGALHVLHYLAPPLPAPDRVALGEVAIERYCQWVSEECGYIQLDGLPADTDLSATRMRLERLFVPFRVVTEAKAPGDGESEGEESVLPVGNFLGSHKHAAILASPGGGKSTLLKRLAIAYAIPGRREEVDDKLPQRNWLPLFLRCRELRDRAHRPVMELLTDLAQHAGMGADEFTAFRERLHEALRGGRALLLVDGLDEISEEGMRRTFAQHLRTFIAMFPHVALLVTSREAGFRHVAGVIASACVQARLAPFAEDDVVRLCQRWHVEVVGDNDQVRSDARALADTIWRNKRIRALAENPLMLTTLLVVRRCIGELPSRRVELYREAVRVLIRTWNTEGFDPMDLEETRTQLSYVACTMMAEGTQQIGYAALLKLLQKARRELAAELEFARISAEEFIQRIEYRSSLLMQTGHERIDGELQPVYEFRHLTFQEYLAAHGFVAEQYPGRDDGQSLADLLEPHFRDEDWLEVVPLAAVLAGRKAEVTVKRLTRVCEGLQREAQSRWADDIDPRIVLLAQCVLDEVQVTPATLRAALIQLARLGRETDCAGVLCGKFGVLFQQLVDEAYLGAETGWEEFDVAEVEIACHVLLPTSQSNVSDELLASLAGLLANGERRDRVRAALASMVLAFRNRPEGKSTGNPRPDHRFQMLYDSLVPLVNSDDPPVTFAATWALAWIGAYGLWRPSPRPQWLLLLYRIWREAQPTELAHRATWAFHVQKALPRDTFNPDVWGDCDEFLQVAATGDTPTRAEGAIAALTVAWYRRAPWDDTSLARALDEKTTNNIFRSCARELVVALGDAGQEVLENWDKERP